MSITERSADVNEKPSTQVVRFDWAVKYLLRNKANFVVLEGFLSELLRTDITITALLESESNQSAPTDKFNRVDVLAELSGGEKVIIEVQCWRQWDYLQRMLYGVSKVVVEHLKVSEAYGHIPRVYSINLVYFNLGEGTDYIYRGRTEFKGIHHHDQLRLSASEREHYPASVHGVGDIYPEYYLLKINQFSSRVSEKLDEWLYLFKNSAVKPEFSAKGISEAAELLDVLSLKKEERKDYERYMDSLRDEASFIETYYDEGREEGFKEGVEAGKQAAVKKIALNMKKTGLSVADIAQMTGLSPSEINV